MNWHPTAEKFPLLEGKEWEDFKEDIRATKGNVKPIEYRMVKGKKQGLDGRNRFNACKELKLPCKEKLVNVPDNQVNTHIIRANLLRRHQESESRQTLVAILRADGHSARGIAEITGIPKSTVADDIAKNAQKPDVTVRPPDSTPPNPAVITGQDGIQRPATRPYTPPKKMCRPCRIGPPKPHCKDCKEMNKPEREPGDDTEAEKEEKKRTRSNGKQLFDFAGFYSTFGKVARATNEIVKAYPGEKNSDEFKACEKNLGDYIKVFKDWHKKITKGKKVGAK